MPRLVGINHVVLEVADLEQALDFYGRLFELELRGRVPRMAFLDMGDQFLVLAEVPEPDGPDGARHFGLVVDDRDEVRRRLEGSGAEVMPRAGGAREPSVSPGRGLDFRDPWGNHVQVVQYGDVQFTKAPPILAGMGLAGLLKSPEALRELREKGLL